MLSKDQIQVAEDRDGFTVWLCGDALDILVKKANQDGVTLEQAIEGSGSSG